jgi:hypothetical protein
MIYMLSSLAPNGVDMMDLNSPVDLPDGVILNYSYDINIIGQVIATAHIAPIPIPEPGIYALFLAGLDLPGSWCGESRKPH